MYIELSDILSVRVSRELKEKMRRYRIDWSEEIRKFLEERVRILEFLETLVVTSNGVLMVSTLGNGSGERLI